MTFQERVRNWCVECFGKTTADDKPERVWRFLEEALELAQALGATPAEAKSLIEYVFGRPSGEPEQEVGGVMITLAALCAACDIDMTTVAEQEYSRITSGEVMQGIRRKQAAKPHRSPLPGAPA